MADATNLSQAVFDLKRDVRQILLRVNGVRSLREIAQGLNLDEGTATRLTDTLFSAGVLERVAAGVFKLNAELWQMLRRFDGVRSLREIAQGLNLDEGTATHSVNLLVTAGFLLQTNGASPHMPSSAASNESINLDWLTAELAKMLGPMAAFVIDDEVGALSEVREAFPRRRIDELIDRVSGEIQDPAKRAQFQQSARNTVAKQIQA